MLYETMQTENTLNIFLSPQDPCRSKPKKNDSIRGDKAVCAHRLSNFQLIR